MQIVIQDAEKHLNECLKEHWQNKSTYRCAHFKLAELSNENISSHSSFVRDFFKDITSITEDKTTLLFQCSDGDLFAIARFLTNKKLTALKTLLAKHLNSQQPINEKSRGPAKAAQPTALLYEIAVEWPKLRALCQQKLEKHELKLDHLRREALRKEEQKQTHHLMQINPDENLINTISQRRAAHKKLEILLVEDDIFVQKLVSNSLEKHGTVSAAEDGYGALMLYAKRAPHILFLDIGLPDISGHTVLKKVFEMDKDAYVVILSGHGDRENIMRAMQANARGFIVKPFTKDKLEQYMSKAKLVWADKSSLQLKPQFV